MCEMTFSKMVTLLSLTNVYVTEEIINWPIQISTMLG